MKISARPSFLASVLIGFSLFLSSSVRAQEFGAQGRGPPPRNRNEPPAPPRPPVRCGCDGGTLEAAIGNIGSNLMRGVAEKPAVARLLDALGMKYAVLDINARDIQRLSVLEQQFFMLFVTKTFMDLLGDPTDPSNPISAYGSQIPDVDLSSPQVIQQQVGLTRDEVNLLNNLR